MIIDDGYDLHDKDTVISLLQTQIDWSKEDPSRDPCFGSYGPNLSQVLMAAVEMLKDADGKVKRAQSATETWVVKANSLKDKLCERERKVSELEKCLKESVEAIEAVCEQMGLSEQLKLQPDYQQWRKALDGEKSE